MLSTPFFLFVFFFIGKNRHTR